VTKELIAELQGIVTKLGGHKGDFTDKAMDNWCNGLICLSAALYHEAHELSRKAHTFPRKAVKELVAALCLLASVGLAQTVTSGPRYCSPDGLTTWTGYVDGDASGVWMYRAQDGVTNRTWYVWATTNSTSTAVQVWPECP
jgi:hypothetical protein